MYTEINSQVEAFFNSQGFAKVTIQPEFPQTPHPSLEDIASCTLKCKVGILYFGALVDDLMIIFVIFAIFSAQGM